MVANAKSQAEGSPLRATIRLGWPPIFSRGEALGERGYPFALYIAFYI